MATRTFLPIGPLADWLEGRTFHNENGDLTFTPVEGIDGRTLFAVRNHRDTDGRPTNHVTLSLADRILTAAGVPLWEVYPDTDEGVPDYAYCAGCDEQVLADPDGVCLWCDTRTGKAEFTVAIRADPQVVLDAYRAHEAGLTVKGVAERFLHRTNYVSANSFRTALTREFARQGWPTRGVGEAVRARYANGWVPLRRCEATSNAGERCALPSMKDHTLCRHHDPVRREATVAEALAVRAVWLEGTVPLDPFSGWVRERCVEAGSASEFARMVGVGTTTMGRWTTGRDGGLVRRVTVRKALGVAADRLGSTTVFGDLYPEET